MFRLAQAPVPCSPGGPRFTPINHFVGSAVLHELDRSLPQRPVPPGVTLLSLRCPQFGAFRVFSVGGERFVSQGDSFFFSPPTEASRSKEFLANREGTAR
jgi:hypothetical protein